MNRHVIICLRDISENMRDAEDFVQGMTFERFAQDKKTVNAVLRSIEVIGEAARHVPDSIRGRYADVPWKEMAGMRDKVIHACSSVDLETVWMVVKERIPVLKPLSERAVKDMEKSPE